MDQVHEYLRQLTAILKLAEVFDIRTTNIDNKEIDTRVQTYKTGKIILPGILVACHGVFSNVPAYNKVLRAMSQATFNGIKSIIIKTHPVDKGMVTLQPEQPRPGITALGFGSYSPDLHKRKPQVFHKPQSYSIFIETTSNTNRMPEL